MRFGTSSLRVEDSLMSPKDSTVSVGKQRIIFANHLMRGINKMVWKWVGFSILNLFVGILVGVYLPLMLNYALRILNPTSDQIVADGLTSFHIALVVFLSLLLLELAIEIKWALSRIHTEADQSIEKFIKQYIETEIDRSILRIFSLGVANDSSTTITFIEFLQGIIRQLESLPEPIRFPILFLATKTLQIISDTQQKANNFELSVPIQIQVDLSFGVRGSGVSSRLVAFQPAFLVK